MFKISQRNFFSDAAVQVDCYLYEVKHCSSQLMQFKLLLKSTEPKAGMAESATSEHKIKVYLSPVSNFDAVFHVCRYSEPAGTEKPARGSFPSLDMREVLRKIIAAGFGEETCQ